MKVSQDELERHRALEWERAERDAASLAADFKAAQEERKAALEELEETRKKARQVGFEIGIRIGRIRLLQEFLGQPETPDEVLIPRPEQDLMRLEESLLHQFSSKRNANGTPPTDKT